jgi:hypothetical protein
MIILRTVQRGSLSPSNYTLLTYIRPTFYLFTYYSFGYLNFLSPFFYFFPFCSYIPLLILVFSLSLLPCLGSLLLYFYVLLSSFFSSSLIYTFIFPILSLFYSLKHAVQTEVVCVVSRLWEMQEKWIQYFLLHTSHFSIQWHHFTMPCKVV